MAAQHSPTVTLQHTPGEVRMPLVGLGTWKLSGQSGYDAIRHALDLGYRHLDTATMYGNESEVGRAVKDSGVPREDIFITTKLPPSRAGRERQTITASLKALGADYVDLWLIHWPPRGAAPQTWQEFLKAREDGLAHAVGVSNYSAGQIAELAEATGETPAVNQIEWSPSRYDERRLRLHQERGVLLEGYSPFKTTNLRHPALVEVADAHGVTPAQVVVRWHLEHGVAVIPKSATLVRLAQNFDVFSFSLGADELAEIDSIALE